MRRCPVLNCAHALLEAVYELTFDFSLECEPMNVDFENGGIADTVCLVAGFDNINVTDFVPVAVSSVQLIGAYNSVRVVIFAYVLHSSFPNIFTPRCFY